MEELLDTSLDNKPIQHTKDCTAERGESHLEKQCSSYLEIRLFYIIKEFVPSQLKVGLLCILVLVNKKKMHFSS